MRSVICITVALLAAPARGEDVRAAAERAAADIAAQLGASAEHRTVKQIGVPPFTEGGAAAGLGTQAADAAAARLAQLAKVDVIERAKLAAVLGERKLQAMTGAAKVDDPELARKAGVQAILAGELVDQGDRIRVKLRLVTSPGNKVIGTAQATADLPAKPAAAVESQGIEVAIRRLSAGLAGGFGRLPGNAQYRRLAVLTFTDTGELAQKKRIGAIVTAEIATDLRRDHNLLLVERTKLTEVLGELKLQQMISVDPAQAGRIGRMADAQALVIGTVAEAGDRFLVNARIVATETGETLAAESTSLQAAGMVALASDAVVLRSRSDAAYRSLLMPGLGAALQPPARQGGDRDRDGARRSARPPSGSTSPRARSTTSTRRRAPRSSGRSPRPRRRGSTTRPPRGTAPATGSSSASRASGR